MTWGKEAAEAQEAIAIEQVRDLQNGVVPDSWLVLGGLITKLSESKQHKTATMLDVGCGVAAIAQFLERLSPMPIHYYGLDTNQAAIDIALEKARGHGLLNADITQFRLPGGFDFVLSNGTLNHIQEWQAALRNMAAMTCFNRWLILHRLWVFHDDTPTEAKLKQAYGQDVWHLRINEAEIVELLEGLGFDLLEKTSSDGSDDPMAGWTYVFERKHDNG